MHFSREQIIQHLDFFILLFLSISVIGSQLYVAICSIGLGGMIILVFTRFLLNKNEPDGHDSRLKYFFFILILFHLLTSFLSSDPAEAFFQNYRHIPLYAIFFIALLFIKKISDLNKILLAFFIFTALISSIELVRYFIDFYSQAEIPISEFRISYFGYPITNAEIKMLVLLLMFPLILSKEEFILNRLWLIILAIPIFLSLNFTNSRNAILGLFSGLVVLGILKYRIFLVCLIIVLIFFLILAPFSIKERILSITDVNQVSNRSRITMWETGIKIIKDHALFGIGEVDTKKIYIKYKPNIEYQGEGVHMHNNILQVMLIFGIPGFLVWLSLMIYIFYRQIKIYAFTKKETFLNTLTLSSLISFIAFQVSGLTQWNFTEFTFAAVMWFNLSLAFIAEKLYKKNLAAE